MSETVALAAGYALIPFAATLLGALAALAGSPSMRLRSALQHFAAGVVFVVATVELLPDVVTSHSPLAVAVSFSLGVLLMLALRALLPEEARPRRTALPLTLLAAVAIDIFVDGLLLGMAVALGARAGRLLALALALEALSLGLALAIALRNTPFGRAGNALVVAGSGSLFLAGSVLGAAVLDGLSPNARSSVLAFAIAALLYLVTEELLAEAHTVPDVPYVTALFFLGFLVFLVLGMVS